MDTFAIVPPAALTELHMDPPDPVPYAGSDDMLSALPPKAIDELLEVAGPGSGSPLLSVELRHLGGALARPEPGHGALAALDGSFLAYSVGVYGDEASKAAVEANLASIKQAYAPYGGVRRYYNFVETKVDRRCCSTRVARAPTAGEGRDRPGRHLPGRPRAQRRVTRPAARG